MFILSETKYLEELESWWVAIADRGMHASSVTAIGGSGVRILFGREAIVVMEFLLLMHIGMNNEESVSSLEAMNFEISWQLLQRNQLC